MDVGIGLQRTAADKVVEDDLSARFNGQRLVGGADGAGGTGGNGDVLFGLDVGLRLARLPAVEKRTGRIGHGDGYVLTSQRAQRIVQALDLDDLLGLRGRAHNLNAAVGANAQALAHQRVVEHAVHSLDGQVGGSAVGNTGYAIGRRGGGLQPIGSVEVPVAALGVGGNHIGEALKLHAHARVEGDHRLHGGNLLRVLVQQRVGICQRHVVGAVSRAVEHRAEDDVFACIRHQHQHVAGILVDVEIVVDAVTRARLVGVAGHGGFLDGHVVNLAVDGGVVTGIRAAILRGRFVNVDLVIAKFIVALVFHRRGNAHGTVAQRGVVDGYVVVIQLHAGGAICRHARAIITNPDIAICIIAIGFAPPLKVPSQKHGFFQRVRIEPGAALKIVDAVAGLLEWNLRISLAAAGGIQIIPVAVADAVISDKSLDTEEIANRDIGYVGNRRLKVQYLSTNLPIGELFPIKA